MLNFLQEFNRIFPKAVKLTTEAEGKHQILLLREWKRYSLLLVSCAVHVE